MAYTRAPFINANPALLGTQQPDLTSMVPPPPDPTLPPEEQQAAHANRGAMILTALKQLGAMGSQPQPVNPADLIPDVGGAKGTAFMGSRLVQTKQEQRLRANMEAAQLKQQQQRDLMQQHAQEQARADQINFQKTKFKNDMDLHKMEMDAKKAEKAAFDASPKGQLEQLKIKHETEKILSGGTDWTTAQQNMYLHLRQKQVDPIQARQYVDSGGQTDINFPETAKGGHGGGGGVGHGKPPRVSDINAISGMPTREAAMGYAASIGIDPVQAGNIWDNTTGKPPTATQFHEAEKKVFNKDGTPIDAPVIPEAKSGGILNDYAGYVQHKVKDWTGYDLAGKAPIEDPEHRKAVQEATQKRIEYDKAQAKVHAFENGTGLRQHPAAAQPQAAPHPQDSEAITWAKANPNDPRAKVILQAAGL